MFSYSRHKPGTKEKEETSNNNIISKYKNKPITEADINNKKVRLLLQHIIGMKTEIDKFTHTEITKYDIISFYDDEARVIELAKNANNVLQFLIENSEDLVKDRVKEVLKESQCELIINKVTFNKVNLFVTSKVELQYQNVIKKFESFVFRINNI